MSIQTELARLTNAKAAIQAAIEGKGVTVPSGTLLDGMAAMIEAIEAGTINLGDYFTDIAINSITPAEDISIGSGVCTAFNVSNVSDLKSIIYVVANNEYRNTIDNYKVRLAIWPRLCYAGKWYILYGTGTIQSKESWAASGVNTGGTTYLLKAGIKYEIVTIAAPY